MSTVATGRRYPAAAAHRARELRDAGWSIDRCRDFIAQEYGARPTFHTFKRWTDPEYQRSRDADVARRRRLRTAYTFRLVKGGDATPEYQAAFVRRLRSEGATVSSIAAACRVVFADESWTYAKARYVLEGR
jgi:hypothetical protein